MAIVNFMFYDCHLPIALKKYGFVRSSFLETTTKILKSWAKSLQVLIGSQKQISVYKNSTTLLRLTLNVVLNATEEHKLNLTNIEMII